VSELYTDELVYDTYRAPAHMTAYQMLPGGFLSAVLVRRLGISDDVRFEVTDYDGHALYAEFTLSCVLTCGGVMLKEPVPNLDMRFRYLLRALDDAPELEIISVNRMQSR